MSARHSLILLVEDNLGDARLVREALRESGASATIHHALDGIDAMAFLRREGEHHAASAPDIILLDLNLPRKTGREVLAEIKGDATLHRIPVVILTSSQSDDDILSVYNLHANCYVPKPADLDHFLTVIRSIEHFWFTTARLPGA
jgi:chemotaxis family two-component system response regulator Rcp1